MRPIRLLPLAIALAFSSLAASALAQPPPTGGDQPPAPGAAPTQPPAAQPAQPLPPLPAGGNGQGATGAAGGSVTLAPLPTAPSTDVGYDTTGSAGARAIGLAPPGTNPSNFMDTRLTWTFGDDDFLHPTGQLIPLSPTFSIADRPQYRLFFDALDSRFSGRENLTHLVMYKKMPAFIPRLTAEAALVLRFDLAALAANTGNLNLALYDSGSYIRLFYNTNSDKPKEGLSAVFFPLDTDRFRLGYLYDITWGGTNPFINQSIFPRIQGSSPGLKVQYDHDKFYVYGGFKTATIIEPVQVLNPGGDNDTELVRVGETNFGFLTGAGYDPLPNLRFDVGGGYFQQGTFDLDDVRGRAVYTKGLSGRVIYHQDMPVPQSIDLILYKNDPMAPMILFSPQTYSPGKVSYSVSLEGDGIWQHLKNFDVSGGTSDQPAFAAALQGVVKAGYMRLSATGIYRDLNYVERSVPGFIPFETLPQNAKTDPELFGSLAVDYYLKGLRLTPGIAGGVQLPSTFRSEFTDGGVPASRTIVVRQQGDESILPYDAGRTPIIQSRLSLRWDIAEFLYAYVWLQYIRDNNGTLVVTDPNEGTASLRVFQSPDRLGIAASLQARF